MALSIIALVIALIGAAGAVVNAVLNNERSHGRSSKT